MYTARLTAPELERLYYQAGLTEIACYCARMVDAPALQELQDDLDECTRERDRLRRRLVEAEVVVFDLHRRVASGFMPQNRGALIAELDKIKLEVT